ncbi:hypothetical protein N7462_005233 [Penicillium macrosclerotiorum]|uniref:uncharacterized protein n=1 Tax=Penicillium macrosclerotiorum TaxID=303699 RepID=UPI002547C925|nr:uncharacterized protein N7462_005233 [Penicillium macrosclerotiorum]KAJ5690841.1 hypothetical protein N7462_005233 [Penicillium macrosclerotiorum]
MASGLFPYPLRVSPWEEMNYNPSPQESEASMETDSSTHSGDAQAKSMLPLLLLDNADTLVFIDPAPEDRIKNHLLAQTIPLRVRSQTLLETGSPYFAKLFNPRSQNRVRRQRGFADRLPQGFKYVIDLTPPTLEDDAIIILTEVSCPMGIRTWALQKRRWKLPSPCVGGQDERQPEAASLVNDESLADEEQLQIQEVQEETDIAEEQEECHLHPTELDRHSQAGLPVEYSGKRHREGIEHILHVLEGLNVTLDTPCKFWTFFAVAKLFKVATIPVVSGYIISWLYHSTNTHFIEMHPEIAYRVACEIKTPTLCQDAFVCLVGDEALRYLVQSAALQPRKGYAQAYTQNRIADFLDDTEVQRIEYASKSFLDETIGHFLYLTGTGMKWLAEIEEFGQITQHCFAYPADQKMVHQFVTSLEVYIRYHIYGILCSNGDPQRTWNSVASAESDQEDHRTFHPGFILQRILSRRFWQRLLSVHFTKPPNNLQECSHASIAEVGRHISNFSGQEHAEIRRITKKWIIQQTRFFNAVLGTRSKIPAPVISSSRDVKIQLVDGSRTSNPAPQASPGPSDTPNTLHSKPLTLNFRNLASSPTEADLEALTESSNDNPFTLNSIQAANDDPSLPDIIKPFFDTTPPDQQSTSPSLDSSGTLWGADLIPTSLRMRFFDLDTFLVQVSKHVNDFARKVYFSPESPSIQMDATDILTCLTNNQLCFLPLWAGGNDDGTGGVFADHDIPLLDAGGFSAPGPSVHTGSVASTDTSFSDIDPSDSQSTIHGASHHATYSHASDLMSVDSLEETPDANENEDHISQSYSDIFSVQDDQAATGESIDLGDNIGYEGEESDGASTVVMDSLNLSDIDMEHPEPDSDEDDNFPDFELVNPA